MRVQQKGGDAADGSGAGGGGDGDDSDATSRSLVCCGLLLCLPVVFDRHSHPREQQQQQEQQSNQQSHSFGFDSAFIRSLKQMANVGSSSSISSIASKQAALTALQLWLFALGGDSYFFVPSAHVQHDPLQTMGREFKLKPKIDGYVAFRCCYPRPLPPSALMEFAAGVVGDVAEVMAGVGEDDCEDAGDGGGDGGGGGDAIGAAAVALVDDVQRAIDAFNDSASAKVTFGLFGLDTHSFDSDASDVDDEDDYDIEDDVDDVEFTKTLTQLNACMFACITSHELLAAACHTDIPLSLQNVYYPNIAAISSLNSRMSRWVARVVEASAASSADAATVTIVRFIHICRRLKFLRNFQGVVVIVTGVQQAVAAIGNACLDRMGQEDRDCYDRLQALCRSDGLYKVMLWCVRVTVYMFRTHALHCKSCCTVFIFFTQNLRLAVQRSRGPCVPFVGQLVAEIRFKCSRARQRFQAEEVAAEQGDESNDDSNDANDVMFADVVCVDGEEDDEEQHQRFSSAGATRIRGTAVSDVPSIAPPSPSNNSQLIKLSHIDAVFEEVCETCNTHHSSQREIRIT